MYIDCVPSQHILDSFVYIQENNKNKNIKRCMDGMPKCVRTR